MDYLSNLNILLLLLRKISYSDFNLHPTVHVIKLIFRVFRNEDKSESVVDFYCHKQISICINIFIYVKPRNGSTGDNLFAESFFTICVAWLLNAVDNFPDYIMFFAISSFDNIKNGYFFNSRYTCLRKTWVSSSIWNKLINKRFLFHWKRTSYETFW